jgi:hypothetical protein
VKAQRLLSVRIIIRLGQHLVKGHFISMVCFTCLLIDLMRGTFLLSFVVGDGVNPLNNEKL